MHGATATPSLLGHGKPTRLEWCVGKVIGKADSVATCIRTNSRPEQKIDAAVAPTMAIGRTMVEDENQAGLNGFLSNPIAF